MEVRGGGAGCRAGQGEHSQTLQSLENRNRGVNHGPLAARLLLGGKVGYIMWEELKEAENCLGMTLMV